MSLKCKWYKIINKYNGIIAQVKATVYNIRIAYKIISKTLEGLVAYLEVKYYPLSYAPFYDYRQRPNSTSKQFAVLVAYQ